jgi:hypothetical protein
MDTDVGIYSYRISGGLKNLDFPTSLLERCVRLADTHSHVANLAALATVIWEFERLRVILVVSRVEDE